MLSVLVVGGGFIPHDKAILRETVGFYGEKCYMVVYGYSRASSSFKELLYGLWGKTVKQVEYEF